MRRCPHAFLIMAHEQPELLQRLISALDCTRADIYVHIDSKAAFDGSELAASRSRLRIVTPRIDVRWGHRSQIEAEYALFEAAAESDYAYYHLISGTHWPLRPVDEILKWFDCCRNRSVLPEGDWNDNEIRDKLGYYHIGLRHLRSSNRIIRRAARLWHDVTLAMQRRIVSRDYSYFHGKHSNWVSISRRDMPAVIAARADVMRSMRHTFCGDEIFIPSVLHAAGADPLIVPDLLFTDFTPSGPRILTATDRPILETSGCLFARKARLPESNTLIDTLSQSK